MIPCSVSKQITHRLVSFQKKCMTGHLLYVFGLLLLNVSDCHPNPIRDKSSFLVKSAVRDRGYKTFFMLKLAEHECFFLLLNVEMPTIFGILIFMVRKNSIISLSEPEKYLTS